MIINVHGGHNSNVPGASCYLDEVLDDRQVTARVYKYLRQLGHTVYDCTDDNGKTQLQNLRNTVSKCNAHKVDLDVSIHFNSGGGHGVECLVFSNDSKAYAPAKRICEAIAELGFTNRGVKVRQGLYVLRHTNSPAVLVECCFVDSKEDANRFNAEAMSKAIVKGITGENGSNSTPAFSSYKVRVTATVLNVRKEASASSAITTKVKKGGVYTIVEEKNNGSTKWGKLKSGAGWISLAYTERV